MSPKTIEKSINYYSVSFLFSSLACSVFVYLFYQIPYLKAFLLSFLVWNVGVRGIVAFIANWIPRYADQIAESYGWEKGQSIQKEIAAADGAFGILGVLSPFFSIDFAVATLIGFCFCSFTSEISGFIELYQRQSKQENLVAKSIIFGMSIDGIVSLIVFVLSLWWKLGIVS